METPHRTRLILILGALTALCPFSIDMYLPTFLQVANDLHVPVAQMSLSLSSFFVGLAAGQLFYGPLLDRFGRKPPLYTALGIYAVAAVACAQAKTLDQLVLFRFLQAIGGCGANVAALAMVRDYFTEKEGAKVFSLLILILAVSPLFAPTVGGLLAHTVGWRWIFLLLAAISGAMGLACHYYLPAGVAPDRTQSLRPGPIIQGYLAIWKNTAFLTYAMSGSLSLAGLFVYVSSSPIIFLEIFKIEPRTYGWLFGLMAMGFVGASQLNFLLLRRFSSQQILMAGSIGMALVGAGFWGATLTPGCGLIGTVSLLFAYLAFFGIANPNAATLALAPFSKNAGSASALMGFLEMAMGAAASVGISFLKSVALMPLAAMFAGSGVIALIILIIGIRYIVSVPTHNTEIPPIIIE